MAYERPLVENAGRELVAGAKVRTELDSLVVGRLRATSIVNRFADAMMLLLVAMSLKRGFEISIRFRGL